MRRPTETRLRRAFADALTTALATAAGGAVALGAAGCGGGTFIPSSGPGDGGIDTSQFTSLCGKPAPYSTLLAGMNPAVAVDGALSRTETAFSNTTALPGANDQWKGTDNETRGNICATASNPAACQDRVHGYRILPAEREACVAAYPAGYFSTSACAASYIATTRGDEIDIARNAAEIKTLIGSIDTLDEALWIAGNSQYLVSCGASGIGGQDSQYRTTSDGGWDLKLVLPGGCGGKDTRAELHIDYAGTMTVTSTEVLTTTGACAGRRPEGLRQDDGSRRGASAVGEHFARMASLEAASVVAFRRLHRQLARHGAPRELLARIRTAARDEIRHARATAALAEKYGVTPSTPRIDAAHEAPSLFAIALENAREGCVRETYGALVAHVQTTRAADPDVRACMRAIADEETEHAALSWDIAAWLESQLGELQRGLLNKARREAFVTLARELATSGDEEVRSASGVPGPSDALRMLTGLAPVLLAAA